MTQPKSWPTVRTPTTKVNSNDLHDASHLKIIGYNNLLNGVAKTPGNATEMEYVHAMHTRVEYSSPKFDELSIVSHTAIFQYTLKKGLKIFGKAGAEAVTKELQQLHDRGVLEPKHIYIT